MQVKNLQAQKGFTLVEIAIVLVIIGLLLGGVLKGQELITNSKIKSVTQDFDGIQAAYYAYQDRLGEVPGDDAGDGLVNQAEVAGGFWSDLRAQGFIKGESSTASGPTHALDGNFEVHSGVTTTDGSEGAMFNKNYICASNIDPVIAGGIDNKVDDGNNATGIIRSPDTYDAGDAIVLCKEL